MSAAEELKAPPHGAGVTELTRDCERCDQLVIWRWHQDGGPGSWAPEPHAAKCGLSCRRRTAQFAEEHGPESCPRCGEDHPKAARRKRRRARRRNGR